MSPNQIPYIGTAAIWRIQGNQINLLLNKVSSVLHYKLWVGVQYLNHLRSFDLMMHFQIIEQTLEV